MDEKQIFLHALKGEMQGRGLDKTKKYQEVEKAADVYGTGRVTAAEIKDALEKAWKVKK